MSKRQPQPFYVQKRELWYVQIGGKQINLGAEKGAAFREYHRLMALKNPIEETTGPLLVVRVIDEYLEHVRLTNKEKTFGVYQHCLNVFYEWLSKESPGICMHELKVRHLSKFREWMGAQPALAKKGKKAKPVQPGKLRFTGNSMQSVMRTVKGCFAWAANEEVTDRNPFADVKLPGKTPREILVSDEQWDKVMKKVTDEPFRDFLILMKETGCRPGEIRGAELQDFDKQERRIVFKRIDSKGQKYNRVVYLNDTAFKVFLKWSLRITTGKIMRNTEGEPWSKSAINSRVQRLKTAKNLGFLLTPYAFRHTFATEGLKSGVDAITVAELMGHRDLTMVARVYGHLANAKDHLRESLEQIGQGRRTNLKLVRPAG